MTDLESIFKGTEKILQSKNEVTKQQLEEYCSFTSSFTKQVIVVNQEANQEQDMQQISLDEEIKDHQEDDSKIQQTGFTDKQIQRLLALVRGDKTKLKQSYACGLVFLNLLEQGIIKLESIDDARIIVNLINALCNLVEVLNGLEISFKLGKRINLILTYLLEERNLGNEHKEYIVKMQQHPQIGGKRGSILFNHHEKRLLSLASSEDASQRVQAMNEIFDIFSECTNYFEQVNLFSSSFSTVLKQLVRVPLKISNEQEKPLKLLMVLLAKFLLTLLVPSNFKIEINPKNISSKEIEYFIKGKDNFQEMIAKQETEQNRQMGNVVKYSIQGTQQVIEQSEGIYSSAALVVNSLLLFHKEPELLKYSLSVLKCLHWNYPNFRQKLQPAITTVLTNIVDIKDLECEQSAATFLYELLSEDYGSQFKEQLNSDSKISELKSSHFYSDEFIGKTPQNKQIFQLENLVIHKTFALQQIIEAEKSFSYLIEVEQPLSIIYIGFATQSKDIKIKFSRVTEFNENEEIKETDFLNERINSEQDPHRLVLLTEKKGLYRVEFDNTYSWYTSKLLRFRCLLLEPVHEEIQQGIPLLKERIQFSPLIFEKLNLNLFRQFDGNWTLLHLLSNNVKVEMDTIDHQQLRKDSKQLDFEEINSIILEKFPYLNSNNVKEIHPTSFLSLLIVYEYQSWANIQAQFSQYLIGKGFLSLKEIEQNRTKPSFQLLILERILQEKFKFLNCFNSLSLEAVEDVSYFWFKHCSSFLPKENTVIPGINEVSQQIQPVILIQKCNPVTKSFVLKLFEGGQLHSVLLEDLDDDLFKLYEHLLKEKDIEEYFQLYCNFISLFLERHKATLKVDSIVFYIDPENVFWTDIQLKLLKNFFETQLPKDVLVPQLFKSPL